MSAAAKTVNLPVQYRGPELGDNIQLRGNTANENTRTVELVWSTGAQVKRHGALPDGSGYGPYIEELSMDPTAVDLERLNSGAPLLNTHMRFDLSDVIGVIVNGSAKIANGIGTATAKFSERAEVDPFFRDVVSGVIRNVSVGYTVSAYEVTREEGQLPVFKATRWTPMEVSAVPVGADNAAGFRAEENAAPCTISFPIRAGNGNRESEVNMPTPNPVQTPSPTVTRAQEIRTLARKAGVPNDFADGLIDGNGTVDEARDAIINKIAESAGPHIRGACSVGVSYDDPAVRVEAMTEALAARYVPGSKPSDHARTYMGLSVVGMARDIVQGRGLYRTGMSNEQIIRAAHGTTDFPELLLGTGDRILRSGYDMAQSGIKPACRERSANDFRSLTTLRVGQFPDLEKVNEHGEIKSGTTVEVKESFKLESYAKIFGLTRQAIINDDLDAFGQVLRESGRKAAQMESSILNTLLASNPTMTEDDTALFHADHGNLAAAGAAINVTSLGAARKALRLMTGLGDDTDPINAEPAYLLVGPEKETEAEQVLASISAAKSSDANPFSGKLQLLVEPRFGASKEWYVLADPNNVPTIEYAYLSSAPGPQLEAKNGFDVLGTEFRVLLDFGAGIADWRGAYKNPGA